MRLFSSSRSLKQSSPCFWKSRTYAITISLSSIVIFIASRIYGLTLGSPFAIMWATSQGAASQFQHLVRPSSSSYSDNTCRRVVRDSDRRLFCLELTDEDEALESGLVPRLGQSDLSSASSRFLFKTNELESQGTEVEISGGGIATGEGRKAAALLDSMWEMRASDSEELWPHWIHGRLRF